MKQIKGNTYYYDSVVSQGGYSIQNDWLIIDTGNDDSSAKKSIRGLKDPVIQYIFNTHSHADHCGGNHYFEKKFAPKIIAPILEDCFIEHPILEPTYLYGARPPKEMENKFLFAKPSTVTQTLTDEDSMTLDFSGKEATFKLLSLPGHSPNMMGIITPDNIAFIGDALLGESFLEKHPLIFTYDVEKHLESILKMATIEADGYVLAHGGYLNSVESLIRKNKAALLNVSYMILEHLQNDTLTFDQLHEKISKSNSLKENLSINQLNRSVLKAHVQYLEKLGDLTLFAEDGKLLFKRT